MAADDEPTRAISLGTIGRFRIIRSLGRGGMGEVYLADDPRLNRSVAVKLLNSNVADDPERRAFFEREATSAAALNHPNICTIFEVGEADGRPYIAMEAVEGRTLGSMLKDGRPPVDSVIAIALQVASALEEARERQVVHRDLKTANIMVTRKGAVKVLDFGLAKRVPPGDSPVDKTTNWVSRTEVVFGTLPYMSPEQALGRTVDHRSDLFSLGTILYESLTGRLPFDGPTTPEVLNAVVNKEQTPPETYNERVSPALSMVVARLLEKDPAARYQSAAEVVDDLRAIQQTGDLARRRAAVSRRRLVLLGLVAAAAVVIGSAAAWWRTYRISISSSMASQPMVVVPATVTGPPQFQFLADAIPNSLTTRLSEHGSIKMKVPPTSIEFGNVGGNLVQVAASYGVTMCIVPRATVASGRLTVNVQIVEPRRRDVVWSGEFDSSIDRYAEAIARAADGVAVVLTGRRFAQPGSGGSSAPSALELALSRGQYYGLRFNTQYQQSDYDIARDAYSEALQIEPRSAAAASGLAYLEIFAMQGGKPPDDALPAIDQWARSAIGFDAQNPLGWAALAVAESWRTPANHSQQLDYGFRAASLGEACGRCQLALMMGLQHFSAVLRYHTSAHDAELDPLSAYGHLNSAVALTALGRPDEASAAIARAAVIEPNALWVSVLRAFVAAASGSLPAAAADAEALAANDSLKTMPPWIGRILDSIRAVASGNEAEIARTVERLREPARHGLATEEELLYLANVVTPVLARAGHTDAALTILTDVTAADAPPPFDMVVLNPFLKKSMTDRRGATVIERSRANFDRLLEAIGQARSAGRFPRYLEQPLQDLLSALRDSGRAD